MRKRVAGSAVVADVERGLHDLAADSVAVGDRDGNIGGHACEPTKIARATDPRASKLMLLFYLCQQVVKCGCHLGRRFLGKGRLGL
jgi:hypothetical protein